MYNVSCVPYGASVNMVWVRGVPYGAGVNVCVKGYACVNLYACVNDCVNVGTVRGCYVSDGRYV